MMPDDRGGAVTLGFGDGLITITPRRPRFIRDPSIQDPTCFLARQAPPRPTAFSVWAHLTINTWNNLLIIAYSFPSLTRTAGLIHPRQAFIAVFQLDVKILHIFSE